MSEVEIRQSNLLALGDGNRVFPPAAKMGVPVMMDIWSYLHLQGRMFTLQEATIGTPLTGQAVDAGGIVLTAPALRLTVPVGLTIFPRRFNLALEAMAGTLNEIAIVANPADSYTSGGVALTPQNCRTDNPKATQVTKVYTASGSAIVEAALTTPRGLWKKVRPAAFTGGETFDSWADKTWNELYPIVGPASFLVYLGAASTALTYLFSLEWAEVESRYVV